MKPKTLGEALKLLDSHIPTIFGTEKEFVSKFHFNLGMWIRNNWGLWDDDESDLHNYFKEKGIFHADDMSGIIFTTYYRVNNDIPINLKKQIQFYKDFWERVNG